MVKKISKKAVVEPASAEAETLEQAVDATVDNTQGSDVQENGQVDKNNVDKKTTKKRSNIAKAVKPATVPERKSCRTPKPVTKEGDVNKSYEVEKIVDVVKEYGKTKYLVRWKGYSRGDDTWENESALGNCNDLLQKFESEKGSKLKNGRKRAASKSPLKHSQKKPKKEQKVEKDYEVEEVVGVRTKNGKKEFKIRWKGYKPSSDTWEPEKNLSCHDLIQQFLDTHQENEEAKKDKEEDEGEESKSTKQAASPKKKVAKKSAKGKGKKANKAK